MNENNTEIPFRSRLKEIMDPYEGGEGAARISLYVDIFIIVCILLSCSLIPAVHLYPRYERLFLYFELVFTVIFIVEYILRWYASDNRMTYPFGKYAIIDLVAILPSILMIAAEFLMLRMLRGIRLLRLLRLLRLIRLFKFFRYGYLIYRGLVTSTIWISKLNERYRLHQLARLFGYIIIAWIIGANLLYFSESKIIGVKDGPYSSYWQSYWHIIIVLVSGIEDKEPVSLLGRVEVTLLMLIGVCFVGILTGEIVSIIVKRLQRSGMVVLKPPNAKVKEHIVILGRNMLLNNIILQVNAATKGRHYILVVCKDVEKLKIGDPEVYKRVLALPCDPLRVADLKEACLDQAIRVIILSEDTEEGDLKSRDNHSLMRALATICYNRNVPMVVELLDDESFKYAVTLDTVEFMVGRQYGEKLIAQAVLNPGVTEIYNSLMTFAGDSNEFYTIPTPAPLVGKTFRQAQLHFLDFDMEAIILIGVDRSPKEKPNTDFILAPGALESAGGAADSTLKEEDNLILLAFERPSIDKFDKEDLWTGKIIAGT